MTLPVQQPCLAYFPVFPQYSNYSILVTLWENVENSSEILAELLSGESPFEYSLINAANIVSIQQLNSAIYRAIHDSEENIRKTRNLHSEVVFCLSCNNNFVGEVKKFGIRHDTRSFYAIHVVCTTENSEKIQKSYENLKNLIKGTETAVTDINVHRLMDPLLVETNYKTQNQHLIIANIVLRGY